MSFLQATAFPEPVAMPTPAPLPGFGMTPVTADIQAMTGIGGLPTALGNVGEVPSATVGANQLQMMDALTGGALNGQDPRTWTPQEAQAQTDRALARIAATNPELAAKLAEGQGRPTDVPDDRSFWDKLKGGVGELMQATHLDTLFDYMGRPSRILPEVIMDWGKESVWKNVGDALTGDSDVSWDDVLVEKFGMDRNILTATLGFIGDVATDPITYATWGVGAINREIVSKGVARAAAESIVATGEYAGKTIALESFRNAAAKAAGKTAEELTSAEVANFMINHTDEGLRFLESANSGLMAKMKAIMGKAHPDARPAVLFQATSESEKAAVQAIIAGANDASSLAYRGGWSRVSEKLANDVGLDKGMIDDILKAKVKEGNVFAPIGSANKGYQAGKEAYQAGAAANAALGGFRLRMSVPVLGLRLQTRRLLPLTSRLDFSVGRRFFAGMSGEVRLMSMVKRGAADVDALRTFWEGGYKALKVKFPQVATELSGGAGMLHLGSAFIPMSEAVGGLTKHLSSGAEALRKGGLVGKQVADIKRMAPSYREAVTTSMLTITREDGRVDNPGVVLEGIVEGLNISAGGFGRKAASTESEVAELSDHLLEYVRLTAGAEGRNVDDYYEALRQEVITKFPEGPARQDRLSMVDDNYKLAKEHETFLAGRSDNALGAAADYRTLLQQRHDMLLAHGLTPDALSDPHLLFDSIRNEDMDSLWEFAHTDVKGRRLVPVDKSSVTHKNGLADPEALRDGVFDADGNPVISMRGQHFRILEEGEELPPLASMPDFPDVSKDMVIEPMENGQSRVHFAHAGEGDASKAAFSNTGTRVEKVIKGADPEEVAIARNTVFYRLEQEGALYNLSEDEIGALMKWRSNPRAEWPERMLGPQQEFIDRHAPYIPGEAREYTPETDMTQWVAGRGFLETQTSARAAAEKVLNEAASDHLGAVKGTWVSPDDAMRAVVRTDETGALEVAFPSGKVWFIREDGGRLRVIAAETGTTSGRGSRGAAPAIVDLANQKAGYKLRSGLHGGSEDQAVDRATGQSLVGARKKADRPIVRATVEGKIWGAGPEEAKLGHYPVSDDAGNFMSSPLASPNDETVMDEFTGMDIEPDTQDVVDAGMIGAWTPDDLVKEGYVAVLYKNSAEGKYLEGGEGNLSINVLDPEAIKHYDDSALTQAEWKADLSRRRADWQAHDLTRIIMSGREVIQKYMPNMNPTTPAELEEALSSLKGVRDQVVATAANDLGKYTYDDLDNLESLLTSSYNVEANAAQVGVSTDTARSMIQLDHHINDFKYYVQNAHDRWLSIQRNTADFQRSMEEVQRLRGDVPREAAYATSVINPAVRDVRTATKEGVEEAKASSVVDWVSDIERKYQPFLDMTGEKLDQAVLDGVISEDVASIITGEMDKRQALAVIIEKEARLRGHDAVITHTDNGSFVSVLRNDDSTIPVWKLSKDAPWRDTPTMDLGREPTVDAVQAVGRKKIRLQPGGGEVWLRRKIRSYQKLPLQQAERALRRDLSAIGVEIPEGVRVLEPDAIKQLDVAMNRTAHRISHAALGRAARSLEDLGFTSSVYAGGLAGVGRYNYAINEGDFEGLAKVSRTASRASDTAAQLLVKKLPVLRKAAEDAERVLYETRTRIDDEYEQAVQMLQNVHHMEGRALAPLQGNRLSKLQSAIADGSAEDIGDGVYHMVEETTGGLPPGHSYFAVDRDGNVIAHASQYGDNALDIASVQGSRSAPAGMRSVMRAVADANGVDSIEKAASFLANNTFSKQGKKFAGKMLAEFKDDLVDGARSQYDATMRDFERGTQELTDAVGEWNRAEAKLRTASAKVKPALVPVENAYNQTGMEMLDIPGFGGLAMPSFMAAEFHQAAAGFKSFDGFHKEFRRIMAWWKEQATWLWPGFHVRNFAGAMFNNMLGGVGLSDYVFARRIRQAAYEAAHEGRSKWKWAGRKLESADRDFIEKLKSTGTYVLNGKHVDDFTYDDLAILSSSLGLTASNGRAFAEARLSVEAIEKGGRRFLERHKATRWYATGAKGMGTLTENVMRTAAFVRGVRTYGDVMEGRLFTMMRHGDYQDLTDFEYGTVRDLIPFYKWMRTNTPLQIHQLLEAPGKLLAVPKLQNALYTARGLDYDTEKYKVPEWLQNSIGLPFPKGDAEGAFNLVTMDIPMSDMFINGREFVSSFLPLVRPLLESYVYHQNTFTGAPIEGKPQKMSGVFSAVMMPIMPLLRATGIVTSGPDGSDYISDTDTNLLGMIPVFSRFRNFLYEDPDRLKLRTSSFMSMGMGLGLRSIDADQMTDTELNYYYGTIEPELTRLREMGYPLPTSDQVIDALGTTNNALAALGIGDRPNQAPEAQPATPYAA